MSSTSSNHLAIVSLLLVGIWVYSVTAAPLQPMIFHASSNNDLTLVETITGGDRVMTPCPEHKQAVDFIENGKPSKYTLAFKQYVGEHKGHVEVAAITEPTSIISDTSEMPPEATVQWRQFIAEHTIPSTTVSTTEGGEIPSQDAEEHHTNSRKHLVRFQRNKDERQHHDDDDDNNDDDEYEVRIVYKPNTPYWSKE